jgi:hypothetical protein
MPESVLEAAALRGRSGLGWYRAHGCWVETTRGEEFQVSEISEEGHGSTGEFGDAAGDGEGGLA